MDNIFINVAGCRFEVQHRGFDDHPADLQIGLNEVDRILCAMKPGLVQAIHARAKEEDESLNGTGVTTDIAKLEKIAFEKATKNWTGQKDAFIWLRAV
jgi:hypothetical protein